jgi:phosphohistidine phosphatase
MTSMLRLILMRHAKSDWSHPGLTDHDRPLNRRGQKSARLLGDWLRARGHLPDEILCSTARRTVETLQGLKLGKGVAPSLQPGLYHADPEAMMRILREATGACVLMIGHNPGICEMAQALVADAPDHDRFDDYPTGATLVCDLDIATWAEAEWHSARTVDFVIPRELGAD